jgi:aminoglycoside phosphotransferase (APT) family kinase protein
MHVHVSTPPAEIHIDEHLVRSLITEQHPDLASLSLQLVEAGWDNAMYRLGRELAVRVPRRKLGAELMENELRFLPALAPTLPLPIPTPVRVGKPMSSYPWSWSIVPWFDGVAADLGPPAATEAATFGRFLRALHVRAPLELPRSAIRGVPLQTRATGVEERMARLESSTKSITSDVRAAWADALAAPFDLDDRWVHGDLHPRNIVVRDGSFAAIIDWGDICRGDPATDLASLWMLFPDAATRAGAIEAYGEASDATWCRARGWAVFFGVTLLETGMADTPRHATIGAATLSRI